MWYLLFVPFAILLYFAILGWYSRRGSWPTGYIDQKLAPCPKKPNCVCSADPSINDAEQQIAPFKLGFDRKAGRDILYHVVNRSPGFAIVKSSDEYLHATATSRFFGFVDDLEFLWDESQKVWNVRSASRVGYSDLGANRKRVERLRTVAQAELEKQAIK
jgi:uncharacterized protein (DUF1499 family)